MKFLIALTLALVTTVTAAQISPVSVALTVGQWIIKDSKTVYKVRVEASGNTPEQARSNGFRKAIELAVGTVVLGEAEAVNDRLLRNEVITYSSGYVDEFRVISESGNRIVMDVWVSNSKIAHRLEAMGVSTTSVINAEGIQRDWERRTTQDDTYNRRNTDAASLAKAVLDDYPRMAFKITTLGSRMTKNWNGEPEFLASYDIAIDQRYADSLKEVLIRTRHGTVSGRDNTDFQIEQPWFNFTRGYWNDYSIRQLWVNTFNQRELFLRVEVGGGSYCRSIHRNMDGWMMGTIPGSNTFVLNTRHSFKIDVPINRNQGESHNDFVNRITNSGTLRAKVVDANQCK
jgi:hypothetical protein